MCDFQICSFIVIKRAILQSGGFYGIGLHRDIPLAEQERSGETLPEIFGVSSLEELRAESDDVHRPRPVFHSDDGRQSPNWTGTMH